MHPLRIPSRGLAAIIFVVLLVIAIVAIAIGRLDRWCYDIFPRSDTPAVRTGEARELLHLSHDDPMAPPSYAIKVVGISGRTATMVVSDPVYKGDGRYAQVWERVYASHHGGKIVCVHLRLVWKGGSVIQDAPVYPSL